jgi:uncharacterized RDD family membrane protein YckC
VSEYVVSAGNKGELWARRVVATMIDFIPFVLLTEILLWLCGGSWLLHRGHTLGPFVSRMVGLAAIAIYFPILMKLTDGQTIGKAIVKIRVVCTDHRPMRLYRAGWREVVIKSIILGTLIPLTTIFGLVGILIVGLDSLWPLWDRENRAFHDMLAGTRVIGVTNRSPHAESETAPIRSV